MEPEAAWSVEFYIEENGRSPAREFLQSLDAKTQTRFAWSLEQLRVRNVTARAPLVRHVEGRLWELREESSTNIYRLLYVFFTGRRIILVHGFQKKTQKMPRQEINIARERLERFLAREGSEQ